HRLADFSWNPLLSNQSAIEPGLQTSLFPLTALVNSGLFKRPAPYYSRAPFGVRRLFLRRHSTDYMALIVQKYGGTSVGNTYRIKNVAARVARYHAQGDRIVVVVSAMSGVTDNLI